MFNRVAGAVLFLWVAPTFGDVSPPAALEIAFPKPRGWVLESLTDISRSLSSETLLGASPSAEFGFASLRGGIRLGQGFDGGRRALYGAVARIGPPSWVRLELHGVHEGRWSQEPSRSTTFMARGGIDREVISGVRAFLYFGFWFRETGVSEASLIPNIGTSFASERDVGIRLGTRFEFSPSFASTLELATWEELEIYNLHNPFVQWTWHTSTKNFFFSNVDVFLRYQILLGFGVWDRVVVGLRAGVPF